MKKPIYERLLQFQEESPYPFHMPGHKRQLKNEISDTMFGWDVTEIAGMDELYDPSGIIRESMEEIKNFYKTEKTWYLVNGSSCGNMAAIGAALKKGESVLITRNCHKSVYQAVELFNLRPYYLYPAYERELGMYGAVSPVQVEEMLKKHRDIRGVVLTSPTYEGTVSDIEAISRICRAYDAVLIVDEAHGAHFAFSDYFPDSAVSKGADLVIQSLHKTMAVPNQGALLHLCSDRVEKARADRYQAIFQTTSPSYILLASMEYGIAHGREERERWREYESLLTKYREKWSHLKKLHLLTMEDFKKEKPFDYDPGKIVITSGKGKITGEELSSILRETYRLEMEMSEQNYVIAMTSYMDTQEGFERLDRALTEIDEKIPYEEKKMPRVEIPVCEMEMIPGIAADMDKRAIELKEAEGKIAGTYVYLYPPGSPILVPGEKINMKVLEKIDEYLYNKMEIKGLKGSFIDIIE